MLQVFDKIVNIIGIFQFNTQYNQFNRTAKIAKSKLYNQKVKESYYSCLQAG